MVGRKRPAPQHSISVREWGPDPGVPCVPADEVLYANIETIKKIVPYLGFPMPEYQRLIIPCLYDFVSYAHLLPASEHHHHNKLGGLVMHSLETVHIALQLLEGKYISDYADNPSHRRRLEPRWQVAVLLGALAHDIGKPFTDIEVFCERSNEKIIWRPHSESLVAWFKRLGLKNYFYRWKPNRLGHHERAGLLAIRHIIRPDLEKWFLAEGPDINTSLFMYLAGDSSEHVITPILQLADQQSAVKNLPTSVLATSDSATEPVGKTYTELLKFAFASMIKSGRLGLNMPGGRLWVDRSKSAWVVWPAAFDMFRQALMEAGGMRDASTIKQTTLAKLLVEAGLAKPNTLINDAVWSIYPSSLPAGTVLRALRFDVGLLPAAIEEERLVEVVIVGETTSETSQKATAADTIKAPSVAAKVTVASSPPVVSDKTDEQLSGSSEPEKTDSDVDPDIKSSTDWFHRTRDRASEHLLMIANQLRLGLRIWDETIVYEDGRIWLRYPQALEGGNPAALLDRLVELQWIVPPPAHMLVRVQKAPGNIDAVPLTKNVGQHFLNVSGQPNMNHLVQKAARDGAPSSTSKPSSAKQNADTHVSTKDMDGTNFLDSLILGLRQRGTIKDNELLIDIKVVEDYFRLQKLNIKFDEYTEKLSTYGIYRDTSKDYFMHIPVQILERYRDEN